MEFVSNAVSFELGLLEIIDNVVIFLNEKVLIFAENVLKTIKQGCEKNIP